MILAPVRPTRYPGPAPPPAGKRVGILAGGLALLSPGLDYIATTCLSQSSFLCAITACYVCALWSMRRLNLAWSIASGLCGGWAILTRPFSALALGAPLAAWFIAHIGRHGLGAAKASCLTFERAPGGKPDRSPSAAAWDEWASSDAERWDATVADGLTG